MGPDPIDSGTGAERPYCAAQVKKSRYCLKRCLAEYGLEASVEHDSARVGYLLAMRVAFTQPSYAACALSPRALQAVFNQLIGVDEKSVECRAIISLAVALGLRVSMVLALRTIDVLPAPMVEAGRKGTRADLYVRHAAHKGDQSGRGLYQSVPHTHGCEYGLLGAHNADGLGHMQPVRDWWCPACAVLRYAKRTACWTQAPGWELLPFFGRVRTPFHFELKEAPGSALAVHRSNDPGSLLVPGVSEGRSGGEGDVCVVDKGQTKRQRGVMTANVSSTVTATATTATATTAVTNDSSTGTIADATYVSSSTSYATAASLNADTRTVVRQAMIECPDAFNGVADTERLVHFHMWRHTCVMMHVLLGRTDAEIERLVGVTSKALAHYKRHATHLCTPPRIRNEMLGQQRLAQACREVAQAQVAADGTNMGRPEFGTPLWMDWEAVIRQVATFLHITDSEVADLDPFVLRVALAVGNVANPMHPRAVRIFVEAHSSCWQPPRADEPQAVPLVELREPDVLDADQEADMVLGGLLESEDVRAASRWSGAAEDVRTARMADVYNDALAIGVCRSV